MTIGPTTVNFDTLMLETENLYFEYNPQRGFHYPDLSVNESETLLILGNSGSGKTTFLHLLSGLLKPSSGNVLVGREKINLESQNDRFRGKHIGLIFQQPYFVNALNVINNVVISSKMAGLPENRDRAIYLLEKLGLADRTDNLPKELSVGELQRVSIARALINGPSVVLADEPTSSLDDDNCHKVAELLNRNCMEEKAALIIVTHDHRLKEHANSVIRI